MTPSEKFKKPIIGTIEAQIKGETLQNGKPQAIKFPVDKFEVIEIVSGPNGSKIYVCNQWYKTGVPQCVPDFLVTNFTKK
jgi:hypothetical protein